MFCSLVRVSTDILVHAFIGTSCKSLTEIQRLRLSVFCFHSPRINLPLSSMPKRFAAVSFTTMTCGTLIHIKYVYLHMSISLKPFM